MKHALFIPEKEEVVPADDKIVGSRNGLSWDQDDLSEDTECITKWRAMELKERSVAREHFIDLCYVFDHPHHPMPIRRMKLSALRRALPRTAPAMISRTRE